MSTAFDTIDKCRSCRGSGLKVFLCLGDLPLADALVRSRDEAMTAPRYPLSVAFCEHCSLVQILETVPPQVLYQVDYPYFSSFSDHWVEHSRRGAKQLIESKALGSEDLVIELASNDGYLLQWFMEKGIGVLGIDPASGPAQVASDRGIPTIVDFFTLALGRRLRHEGISASVVIGNNVLAHVPDQNDLVAGVSEILADDGWAVFEFPYVADLIENGEFDTIYHEHHCYFSVHSVKTLFERHGLKLVNVDHLDTHGGSLRCRFARTGEPDSSVHDYLQRERQVGMTDYSYYGGFAERVEAIRTQLIELITSLRNDGTRVAAYGAAAKGATLLNYARIGDDLVDYVVDRNTHKQGWFMPGTGLEVRPPDVLVEDAPDFTLLLPWNHAPEIIEQQTAYTERGGRFIVPIPTPRILDPVVPARFDQASPIRPGSPNRSGQPDGSQLLESVEA